VRRFLRGMALVGSLIALGNYVFDGWTIVSSGRSLYTPSNVTSVLLLTIAGSVGTTILIRGRSHMAEEERKDYQATLAVSVLALLVLLSWILFRASRAS